MHPDISKYNFAIITCELGLNNYYVMNDSLMYISRRQVVEPTPVTQQPK
jgi:hypothetical protein